MRAIMYHYVREPRGDLPFFRYLHVDDFRRQLDHFAATDRLIGRDEFEDALAAGRAPADGTVLTFDDALADHMAFVLPELAARGLWGLFYIPTGMYESGRLLDVHRVHFLLGAHGGERMLAALRGLITDGMLVDSEAARFAASTYAGQGNDAATDAFKLALNYQIAPHWRTRVLDELMHRHGSEEAALVRSYYLSPGDIRALQAHGMVVGSHTVGHPVMSRLPVDAQRAEIEQSFAFLERVTGGLDLRSFCYPYGGFTSFTAETERLLEEAGSRFAFNVEPRDIGDGDLARRPQALPRYDCNLFPHGRAWLGASAPESAPAA